MRPRILTVLSVTFGVCLLVRAVYVSSEVVPGQEASAPTEQTQKIPTAGDETQQCLTGAVYEAVTADLQRLEEREVEINEREVALAAVEKKLATQLTTVEKANAELQANLEALKTVANDDLRHLVSMYETMKPKQAAEIFDSMDASFAAGFLREMTSDNAGLVMANMDPKKSYAISVIIAGRNSKFRQGSP